MPGSAEVAGSSGADRASLILLAGCAVAFVQISREGERAVVDAAAGRSVFLLGSWGIAMAALLCLLLSPARVWRPTTGSLGLLKYGLIAGGWLLVVAAGSLLFEYTDGPTREEVVGALMGWVLVEEFLFRGALFDLVDRVFPRQESWDPAIVITALLFALSHLQYHDFDLAESAGQVLYVIPTGVLFGYVRRESQSIWPSIGLHSIANTAAHLFS